MNRTLSIACGIIVMSLASLNGNASGDSVSISMEVSIQRPKKGEYLLHIKLTNQQPVPISLHNINLPWIPPNEFALVPEARRLDAKRSVLRRGGPPADYMDVIYHLKPGESLEGDVKLHSMFPTFLNDIENYSVLVKWSCKAKQIELTCKQGAGGEFVIPKGGLPESSPSKKEK